MLEKALRPADFAVAALWAQLFTVYLLVCNLSQPPTAANWERADPILRLLPQPWNIWFTVLLAVGLGAFWWNLARPSGPDLRQGSRLALAGLAAGCLATLALRLLVGPHLPSFIPAEENAGPGPTLSMTAGFAEELLFRLMLLPAVYFGTRARLVLATAVTALGFALLHEAGQPTFTPQLMATRFLVPGCGMTLLALLVHPAFTVCLHGAAHLLLPVLFLAD